MGFSQKGIGPSDKRAQNLLNEPDNLGKTHVSWMHFQPELCLIAFQPPSSKWTLWDKFAIWRGVSKFQLKMDPCNRGASLNGGGVETLLLQCI